MVDREGVRAPEILINPARPRVEVIGIGVQKAATSWLFRCLTQHAELRGSNLEEGDKELNFFNRNHEYGYDWYENHFEVGPWKNVEFSVLYFHDRNVPERIKAYNPDARLLLCLRNPVERAISQYRHEIRHGRLDYKAGGFWAAVARNPSYVEQGLYGSHLERWLEHFDLEQILILDYDDVRRNPGQILESTFRFLGVASDFRPSLAHQRTNRSVVRAGGASRKLLHLMAGGLRLVVGPHVMKRLRRTRFAEPLQRYRYVEVEGQDELPPGSDDRKMFAQLFRGDLARLEGLLRRNYGHWD